jgi:hypothetical protein
MKAQAMKAKREAKEGVKRKRYKNLMMNKEQASQKF